MTSSLVARFVRGLVAWRNPLLMMGVILGLAAIYPAKQVTFDRSIENMFAKDDPLLTPFRQLKRIFGGSEIAMAAYIDPQLMTLEGIRRLDSLTKNLEKVPGVKSVLSLSNGPLRETVIEDKPISRRFVELFEGYLVGADRETAGVVCLLDTHSQIPQRDTVEQVRKLVEAHDPSGVLVGEPVMIVDGFRYLEEDGVLLGFASTTLLMITIIYCFRSVRWVLVPLAVVQLSILGTQAILALSGLRLSMVSSMLTAIITIIGVVKITDLTVLFRDLRAHGHPPSESLEIAGTRLATPIFWACVTDAAGFGALLAASAGPVNDFGLMMAIGSMVVLLAVVLLVPGLALIGGRFDPDPRRAWGEGNLDRGLARLSLWIEHHPTLLGVGSLVLGVLAGWGCLQLRVETDFTKNFRATSPIVRSYELVENRLGGAGVWDIIVPIESVTDWDSFKQIRAFESRLREEVVVPGPDGQPMPGLTKVVSAVDAIDALSPVRLDNMPAFVRRGMMNTAVKTMKEQMPDFYAAIVGTDPDDEDRQYVRIMLRAKERQEAEPKRDIIAQVEKITLEEFPEGKVTGFFVLLTNIVLSMTRDQWITFGLATAGIFLTMLLAFRSLRLALIALVPNALPVFMVTGLVGWLGVKINMGAAMIAAVSMGLSVDSSTHFIAAFLEHRGHGSNLHSALYAVHQSVGRAMIFSTVALVMGFSALVVSQFVPTIYFGALVGLTMFGGLIGNLIVLPLLLAVTEPKGDREEAS